MASVFKRATTKPIPAGARIIERKAGPIAEWVDGRGRRRTAPLTEDRSAIRIESETYTVKYRDEHGLDRKVSSRCTDKTAAEQLGSELETRAMKRREGLLDPAQERFAREARRPIVEHAADHVTYLRAAGNTEKHVVAVERHLRVILAAAGIERLSELKSAAVLSAVSMMRNPAPVEGKKRQPRPASLSTCNGYLRSMKGFSRWLWEQRRTPEDGLLGLGLFNAATDRRHVRREMTADEVRWLLDATERRTTPDHGAPGPVRAMCYRLAAATGYRASELRSLTTDSFALDGEPPTCSVAAGYSKRRRHDEQPLPGAMVEPLRVWLSGYAPGERVFSGIARHTARMLRSDLAAARGAWLDEAGDDEAEQARREASDFLCYADRQGHVADFHSLRTVYISRVVAGGASMKEAQTLARHSTPLLTAHYSRATLHDVAGRVEGLGNFLTAGPVRPTQESAILRATGTDGKPNEPERGIFQDVPQDVTTAVARCGSKRPDGANSAVCSDPELSVVSTPTKRKSPRESRGLLVVSIEEAPVGVEPTMADLQSAALATWLRSRIWWAGRQAIPLSRYGRPGKLVKVCRLLKPDRSCVAHGSIGSCLGIGSRLPESSILLLLGLFGLARGRGNPQAI